MQIVSRILFETTGTNTDIVVNYSAGPLVGSAGLSVIGASFLRHVHFALHLGLTLAASLLAWFTAPPQV